MQAAGGRQQKAGPKAAPLFIAALAKSGFFLDLVRIGQDSLRISRIFAAGLLGGLLHAPSSRARLEIRLEIWRS